MIKVTITCPRRTLLRNGTEEEAPGFFSAGLFFEAGIHRRELEPAKLEELLGEIRRGESILSVALPNGETVTAPPRKLTSFEKEQEVLRKAAAIKARKNREEREAKQRADSEAYEAGLRNAVARRNAEESRQRAGGLAEARRLVAEDAAQTARL